MKKLLLILLLASPCFGGEKYSHGDSKLNDEVDHIYYSIDTLLKATPVRISSAAISSATITNLSVTNAISSATITNLTVTTLTGYSPTAITVSTLTVTSSTTLRGSVLVSTNIAFSPTTAGIVGTTAVNNAAVGIVGEVISASVVRSAGLSLTTATGLTIASVSLTPGDWDVMAQGGVVGAAGTSLTALVFSISLVDNTSSGGDTTGTPDSSGRVNADQNIPATVIGTNTYMGHPCRSRVSISVTTTYYLVIVANFTVSTLKGYGSIVARRTR